MKPKPAFEGYNKTTFIKGQPTKDNIGKNIPRTFFEKERVNCELFFPYEAFIKNNDNISKSLKTYLENNYFDWQFPIVFIIENIPTIFRNELIEYLRDLENFETKIFSMTCHGYFHCFIRDYKEEKKYKKLHIFIMDSIGKLRLNHIKIKEIIENYILNTEEKEMKNAKN